MLSLENRAAIADYEARYSALFERQTVCCHKETHAIINFFGDAAHHDIMIAMLGRVGQSAPRVQSDYYPTYEELPVC